MSNQSTMFAGAALALCLAQTAALGEERAAELAWSQRATLSTPVSGVVDRVMVAPGERVERGSLLLSLDERPFAAHIRAAKAAVSDAEQDLEEMTRELDRALELYDRTLLSDHERALARIAHARAEARLETARAALALAELDRGYSRVTAPFDGVVVATLTAPGETVVTRQEATALVVLAATHPMLARFQVAPEALDGLRTGTPAQVHVVGRHYAGQVERVALEPSAGPGEAPRYAVDVVFEPDPDVLLRAGQPARVELP
jgi:RND family efflux transporter MFP subunit